MSLLPTSSCHEPVLSCHRFLRSWWFHDTETSQALRSKQVLAWLYIRSDSESVDPAFNGCNERSEIRAVGRGRVKLVHTQDGYGLVLGDVFSRNYDPHIYNKIEVFFRSGYYLLQLKGTWRRTTQTEDGNIFRNFCRFCNCWLTVYIYTLNLWESLLEFFERRGLRTIFMNDLSCLLHQLNLAKNTNDSNIRRPTRRH